MNHIRPVFLKLAFTVSMLLLASIAVTPAKADLVTFAFQGTVETIGSNLLHPDSPFGTLSSPIVPMFLSGSYMFESTTPNGISGIPQLGVYSSSISNLTFQVREGSAAPFYSNTPETITIPPPDPIAPNVIIVQNDFLAGDGDVYQVKMHFSGTDVNTHAASSFTIDHLSVFPANPFSDNLLPTTPPGLGGIGDRTSFQINFEGGVGSTVRGNITSLTLVANPLPPAVILFGAGLVALVGLGAGSWRQRKNGLA